MTLKSSLITAALLTTGAAATSFSAKRSRHDRASYPIPVPSEEHLRYMESEIVAMFTFGMNVYTPQIPACNPNNWATVCEVWCCINCNMGFRLAP